VQVFVRDNNVDGALKALKKKMQREGTNAGFASRRKLSAGRASWNGSACRSKVSDLSIR
jgi:hypothetical protein